MEYKRPQVLLLGNGINRAYGGASWNEFLKAIATRKDLIECLDSKSLKSPMPLQAILLTDDSVNNALKEVKDKAFGEIKNSEHADAIKKLLSIGFDHILTTNYSYELEMAAQLDWKITESKLKRMQEHTVAVKTAEPKYLLSTYNQLKIGDTSNKIWHIHGEARKPNSMVLGHYYYGNLLYEIKDYVVHRDAGYDFAERNGNKINIKSWIDAFILGDIYVLGLGLDLAEIDLWWLLNRKKNEKANHGQVFFYEPTEETCFNERLELIKIFAKVKTMGVTISSEKSSVEYQRFYESAIEDIGNKVISN